MVIDGSTSVALLLSDHLPFVFTNVFVLLHVLTSKEAPALNVTFTFECTSRDVTLQLCVLAMTALNLLVVAINGIEDIENAACPTEPWITFSVKPPAQTSLILKTHTIVFSSTSTTLISSSAGFGAAAHPLARSSIAMTRASGVFVTRSGVGARYERNPIV